MQFAADRRTTMSRRVVNALSTGTIVLLMLLLGEVLLASRVIELAHWATVDVPLWSMGVAGVLFGFIIARLRVPDLLVYLAGFSFGLIATLYFTSRFVESPEASTFGRIRLLLDDMADWIRESIGGRQSPDELVLIGAMGLLIWLIAYISAWFLFRRGWFLPAVTLPAVPIALNLGAIGDGTSAALLVYVVLALSLAAVQVARLRTAHWRQAGLAFSTIAWRAPALGGALIALLAVALVWSSPVNPPDSWLEAASDRLEAPVSAIESVWDDLNRRLNPPTEGGGFAQFGDSFEMGGELNLSDQPVALLIADQPHYLAAQRFDVYTGSGWRSSTPDQIRRAGSSEIVDAPLVAFQNGQQVYLSDDVMMARTPVGGTIEVLAPTGSLLFTIEAFSSADAPFSATVSWRELRDERFELVDADLADIPVELRNLAIMLRAATFEAGDGGLRATDPALDRRIEREVAELLARYLSVRITVDTSGEAIALFATGFVPNYDDIESVAAINPVSVGTRYEVNGWRSAASAESLRAASTVVPDFVADRYLQLPNTVSDETRGLALSITQGTNSTFDAALAIQTYLRATYPYEEAISGPRAGVDAVHYFLFDERQGYCEYFASAMVVMLRSLDIPSRLVSGLMEVPWDAEAQGYLYSQKQAHTWVEVYFDGYGWVPFEPTPARGEFDYERSDVEEDDPPTPTPVSVTPTAEAEPTATVEPTPTEPAAIATIDQGDDRTSPWRLGGIILAGLVAAGVLFWLAWRSGRGHRVAAPGAHYYGHLVKLARRYGVLPSSTTTPRELAERIGSVAPAAAGPATEITGLYRKELYAGQKLTPDDRQTGEAAIKRLRSLLRVNWLRRSDRKGSESP